jgi:hypothetical protein
MRNTKGNHKGKGAMKEKEFLAERKGEKGIAHPAKNPVGALLWGKRNWKRRE